MSEFRREVSRTINYIAKKVLVPILYKYMTEPIQLKDGRVVQGKEALDEAIRQNKDLVQLMLKYRPEYMKYINVVKGSRDYIQWDTDEFLRMLVSYMKRNGIELDEREKGYVREQIENFRRLIYED